MEPGTKLGSYEIIAPVGAGGMGEVYRARDTTLDRDVAIKVLPPDFADDPDRSARFEREAKALAALNHPNIAQVYGLEAGAIVMELVEGATLDQRIKQGPLPIDEAVAIARQITHALEAAHLQGIVHRDLKPANIKVTEEGTVKVLDFGLAKASGPVGQGKDDSAQSALTMTSPAMTEIGMILGTAAYMAPEQARGKRVDKRADVWAFGVVLYEMLTGARAFAGSDVTDVLASVLAREPDWTLLPAATPPVLETYLRRCLEKEPKQRIHDIADVRLALEGAFDTSAVARSSIEPLSLHFWQRPLFAAAAGLVIIALATTVAVTRFTAADGAAGDVLRYTIPIGQSPEVYLGSQDAQAFWPSTRSVAISPDGRFVVYSARSGDDLRSARLYLHWLNQERAEPISGTENAVNPFVSPGSDWIGFSQNGIVKRVSVVSGGIPETVTSDVYQGISYGLTWGDDDTIVQALPEGLYRVPATGGERQLILNAEAAPGQFASVAQPHLLPGSQVVLFHSKQSNDPAGAEIRALDLTTEKQTTVISDAMDPTYLATGHLLFVRRGTLMAVGFDPVQLETDGDPFVVRENVMQALSLPNLPQDSGAAQVAVSTSGTLVYASGGLFPERLNTVMRIGRDGAAAPVEGLPPREYRTLRLSPDEAKLAFAAGPNNHLRIWVHDFARGVADLLDVGGYRDWPLTWGPDSRSLAITSDRDVAVGNVYIVAADGSGEPQRVAPSTRQQRVMDWSSTNVIVYEENRDIWAVTPGVGATPTGEATPVVTDPLADDHNAVFSPNGQWLAYVSYRLEDLVSEVYLRPYPGPGTALKVSDTGGNNPVWSRDGTELYYRRPGVPGALMVVKVVNGTPGRPTPLIEPWVSNSWPVRYWDVFRDGTFLNYEADEDPENSIKSLAATQLHVVLNWFEELKNRRVVR